MTVFPLAPIASTEPTHRGSHTVAMNNPAPKCAAPECSSRARDGHVCDYHYGTLYAARTFDAGRFVVIANDPEREWICRTFIVRAFTELQAKDAVRAELAKIQLDHWSLQTKRAA